MKAVPRTDSFFQTSKTGIFIAIRMRGYALAQVFAVRLKQVHFLNRQKRIMISIQDMNNEYFHFSN